ncbi:unnamed protein product, partial [Rhizoctonia solani]
MLRSIVRKHQEEIPQAPHTTIIRRALDGSNKMDLLGMLIFLVGFGLVQANANILWIPYIQRQPGEVAMLIIGFILIIPVFTVWELCYSSSPLMPKWAFQNQGVLCGLAAGFCAHLVTTFVRGVAIYQPPE